MSLLRVATGSDSYSSPDYSSANSWTVDEIYSDSFDLYQGGTYGSGQMSLSSHMLDSYSDGEYDSHRQGWSSSPDHYMEYTDDYDWSYLTTRHEEGSYSSSGYSFTTYCYLNTSDRNSYYHEEGWDLTYSSYTSDSAGHDYSIYTEEGAGTVGTYTDHSDGWSSSYFYAVRWDGGVDSDSSYDSYVNDDSGAITLDSAAWPPEPTFNLPSPQAWLRAYLAAVDSYFAGNHGPHAIGRGPNALGRERSIHGDHESGMHAAIIDLVHAEGAGGGPSSNASGPQVTNLASRGTPRQSQSDAPSGPATQPPATEPAASASSLDAPALVGGFFDGFMTGLGGVVDAVASVGEEVVNVVQGVLNTPVGSFGKTKITLWDLFDPSPSTTTLPGMPIRPKGNPDPNGSYTLTASQGNAILDGIQLVLDIAGLLPVVGEPADAISGLISLARGARWRVADRRLVHSDWWADSGRCENRPGIEAALRCGE